MSLEKLIESTGENYLINIVKLFRTLTLDANPYNKLYRENKLDFLALVAVCHLLEVNEELQDNRYFDALKRIPNRILDFLQIYASAYESHVGCSILKSALSFIYKNFPQNNLSTFIETCAQNDRNVLKKVNLLKLKIDSLSNSESLAIHTNNRKDHIFLMERRLQFKSLMSLLVPSKDKLRVELPFPLIIDVIRRLDSLQKKCEEPPFNNTLYAQCLDYLNICLFTSLDALNNRVDMFFNALDQLHKEKLLTHDNLDLLLKSNGDPQELSCRLKALVVINLADKCNKLLAKTINKFNFANFCFEPLYTLYKKNLLPKDFINKFFDETNGFDSSFPERLKVVSFVAEANCLDRLDCIDLSWLSNKTLIKSLHMAMKSLTSHDEENIGACLLKFSSFEPSHSLRTCSKSFN